MARTLMHRRVFALLSAVIAVGVVSGCAPEPAPTPTASPDPVVSAPAPTPTGPMLAPEGTAADNLPYFTDIVRSVWSGPEQVAGRAYVDALTAAGFDKAAMQVTPDQTTVGNAAESIQFSVRWGEECLIGQVGPATGEPVTAVMPGLQSGGCLVGNTRPIDW